MTALRIVMAFKTEANLLVDHLDLKKLEQTSEFPIFARQEHALVLSGLGASAAAAATTYLYETYQKQSDTIWLNIGIAGHTELAIGTVVLVNQVTNEINGETWKTTQDISHDFPTSPLITVSTPETEFKQKALYDMESAGFYAAASQIPQCENIYCLKIVSDNKKSPLKEFSTKHAAKLIAQATPSLIYFIDALLAQDQS